MAKKLLDTDMHIHTSASDGDYSSIAIYQMIKWLKIKNFAITDHDTLEGAKILQKYLIKNPDGEINFIPGVEMTTNIKNANYRHTKAKLHILGYGMDLNHCAIKELIAKRREITNNYLEKQIYFLDENFNIAFSRGEIKQIFLKSAVNDIDVAKLLVRNGYALSLNEAYNKYINLAKKNISIDKIYEDEVLSAIKEAGGYTSLAHPTSLRLDLETLKDYLEHLKKIGLDAVEVYHSQQKRQYSNQLNNIAEDLGLYVSGGSDYHGPVLKPLVHLGLDKGKGKQKVLTLKEHIINNK